MEKLKFCIFGGAFNPIHKGHVKIARSAITKCGIDKVIWVPTDSAPHKSKASVGINHRLAMINIAVGNDKHHILSDIETTLSKPSYTIQTIKHLKRAFGPHHHWSFLMGADSWGLFNTWKNWQDILHEVKIIVFPRSGSSLPVSVEDGPTILNEPTFDISSSNLREAIYYQRVLDESKVFNLVINYIRKNKLYL